MAYHCPVGNIKLYPMVVFTVDKQAAIQAVLNFCHAEFEKSIDSKGENDA